MKTITINLNPETREELCSDISPEFLAFVLMEALYNVVKDIPHAVNMFRDVVSDETELLHDPDSGLMESSEYLSHVLMEWDRREGKDVTAPDYTIEEYMSEINVKLALAVESIAQFNDLMVLAACNDFFETPEVRRHLSFSTRFFGDSVVFSMQGAPSAGIPM